MVPTVWVRAMSGRRSWAHACSKCGHLANVHEHQIAERYRCAFCECIVDQQSDFDQGITEKAARQNHAAELDWISERWP